MRARLIVASVCVMLTAAGGSWAGDATKASGGEAPAAVAAVAVAGAAPGSLVPASIEARVVTVDAGLEAPVEPWIHPSMPGSVRNKLENAFQQALQKVTEHEECAAVFTRLGADGVEVLKSALYFPVNPGNFALGACRGNIAYTYVGASTTFVCREFAYVSDGDAVMYVLHEALHNAGLSEKPIDPNGMTPHQIDRLVERRCGGAG